MIGVAITTRNEAATIGRLVEALIARGHVVCVADAASSDGTPDIAEKAGAYVIRNEERISIRDGLLIGLSRLLLTSKCDRFVTMDAGGSHLIGDLDYVLTPRADLVIGSRFMAESEYVGRPFRALCSRLAAAACNIAQPGAAWSDWTSGYRVWSRRAVNALFSQKWAAEMHGWQIETLAWAGRNGFTIAEAPIDYRAGRSSMTWKIAGEALGVWWGLWQARSNPANWVHTAEAR